MFRHDANVRENKSVAGSRSLPGRQAAAGGSAPREAGTELRGGRGRFLPPGIVPPGSPGLTPATCYFLQQGAFRGKYVPAGLGHLPPRGPAPRPRRSSCSGRAAPGQGRRVPAGRSTRLGAGGVGEQAPAPGARSGATGPSPVPLPSLPAPRRGDTGAAVPGDPRTAPAAGACSGGSRQHTRGPCWRLRPAPRVPGDREVTPQWPQRPGGRDGVGGAGLPAAEVPRDALGGDGCWAGLEMGVTLAAPLSWHVLCLVLLTGPGTGASVTKAPAVGPQRPAEPWRSWSPPSRATRRGPQPPFGCWRARSLDARQSVSPSRILSPSPRLIGGGAALLPAPRSRSVPAAGVVSTTVRQIPLPAPPAARSP